MLPGERPDRPERGVRQRYLFLFVSFFLLLGTAGPADLAKTETILVPAGEFTMGSSEKDIDWTVKTFFSESKEWYQDETPSFKIVLNEFHIDKYEVTTAQYRVFMEAVRRPAPKFSDHAKHNAPDQPVVGVAWQDASDYCQWAGKRLPTEAEWEKAARGTDGRIYPWGNDIDDTKANVRGMADKFRYAAPAGSFPQGASPYGVHDMSGNVWEWTSSWYLPYPGNKHENENYGEKYKVIKGGSWNSNMDLARVALRGKAPPDQQQNYIGFRCAGPRSD
ncbi:MAG: SUMF1/EgtB/PvdO family nonheme iron enzyme [Nitrospinae bacterium]|nr:SUMF1/EgtB/PvdO family nonheme iron enzyme [Nitrospinota bacterium]